MPLTTEEIKARARARLKQAPASLLYVEVTFSDGTVEVMTPDQYNALTTTDTAHRGLRMIGAAEAACHPRRVTRK